METLNIALIGCGSFVRDIHLANLMSLPGTRIFATVDVNVASARQIAEASGAAYWTDDPARVFSDPNVRAVLIATPHYTHADLTIRAARAGKHIFCEKPMALSLEDCLTVTQTIEETGVKYIAGYNRPMAPLLRKAQEVLAGLDAPMLIQHRWANWNPYGKGWLIDEALSGGRVLGEAGHSLDMMCRLTGQDPVRVYAEGGNFGTLSPTRAPDSALITLGFPDGSAGTLLLSSVGNDGFPKEEVVITCANHTIAIYGFQRMVMYAPDGCDEVALPEQDRGHKALLEAFVSAVRGEHEPPIGVRDALRAARMTHAARNALRTHAVQTL